MAGFIRFSVLSLTGILAFGSLLVLSSHAAQPQFAGQWDMSLDNTNRKCRVTLRMDAPDTSSNVANHALAMPMGCKRAMPILSDTTAWIAPDAQKLVFADVSGKAVLDFTWATDHSAMISKGPEGETYQIRAVTASGATSSAGLAIAANETPVPGFQPVDKTKPAVLDAPPPVATPAPAAAPAMGGKYAVVRDAKKPSNCTLVLDAGKPSPKGNFKASLEPGCADTGMKIFDPVAWRLDKDHLTLVAKRGHETALIHQADDTWAKDPVVRSGALLSLKKL